MAKDGALEALTQALRLEQEGRAFYLQVAEESFDDKAKEMFESLADDEAKHVSMIERQLRAIETEGDYALLPDVSVADIDLGQKLFPPDLESIRETADNATNVLEVLHMALDNEIRSYDLYCDAAQSTESQAGHTMYAWLANEEMQHFELLMSNWESLATMGGWV